MSIISCRVILNIRQYGVGHQSSDTDIPGAADTGEVARPTSGLRFEHTGRSSGLDTELGLY